MTLPSLTVYIGSVGHAINPTHPSVIGRAADCDVVVADPHVSHHHAKITPTADGWLLEDLGSANGLTVNGVRVTQILIANTTTVMLATNVPIICTVAAVAPQPASPRPAAPERNRIPQAAPTAPVPAQIPQAPAPRPAPAARPAPATQQSPRPAAPIPPQQSPRPAGNASFPGIAKSLPTPPVANDVDVPSPTGLYGTVMAGSTQAQRLESQLKPSRVLGDFDPKRDRTGVIGRTPNCTIRISDYLVSRKHCSLEATPNGILLTDLDSANGTYVNGRRVAKVWLEEGDVITVGNTDLTVAGGVLQDRAPLAGTDAVIAENIGLTVGKGVRLLDGIDAVFAKGTLTAVIGPSGAGKSTFTSIVAGLNSPTEGHVLFDGYDVHQNIELLRSRIGFVPQDDVVHRKLTVDAALEYAAKLRLPGSSKAERAEIIDNVLAELELTQRRHNRIDRLSGGQRKRVSTAIELLTGPELLILDEPTSGLDPSLDQTVMKMLRQLADAGRVVLVVTHSLTYVEKYCDNVLMLAPGGHPAFFGTPAEMRQAFGDKDWADIFNDVTASPEEVHSITDTHQRMLEARKKIKPHEGHEKPAKVFRFRQMLTLVIRQIHLIIADPGLLVFLLLLPLLLGMLSLVVPGSHGLGEPDFKDAATEPSQLLALVILGACFMGSALSVRDIVSERAIYDRERAVGLSPSSYTASKLIVMALQTLLQAAILTVAVSVGKPRPESGVLTDSGVPELVLVVWLTAWASAMLGEVGSALVKSGEQTMPLLVILVMAQLVFSGGMIPVTDRDGLEQASMVFPGRWGFSAAASDIDLNGLLYGPTKVPTFKKDDLWEHSTDQFWFDIAVLVGMVVVFTIVLRVCVSNVVAKRRR